MERYAEAMTTLVEVQDRCKDMVSALQINNKKDEEEDDLSTPRTSVSPMKKNDDGFFRKTKLQYVDLEVQELLPDIEEDCKWIGDVKVRTTIRKFLVDYENLVQHETVLNLDRDVTLRELHKDVIHVGDNAERNIVLPDWDSIVDEVGDPKFHKELDIAEKGFKDYCKVEDKMLGISTKIKELKKVVTNGNEARQETMNMLYHKKQRFLMRTGNDICQEQIYRLQKVNWTTYSKEEKAKRLNDAIMDLEIVQDSYEGLQQANEEMEAEYKSCLAMAADKRKALLCHMGIKFAKEALKQDAEHKATFKRQLEDYTTKYKEQLQNMNQLQVKIKEDRDKIMLQVKKMHTMMSGGPMQGVTDLVNTMEVTGFTEFGKLTAPFTKTADLSSQDDHDVVGRLREAVVEVFRMKNTMTELETHIKNDTFTFLVPYHDKAEQIKATAKLPKSMNDDAYLDQLKTHLMANNRLIKQFSVDTAKFSQQRVNLGTAVYRCEKAMTFGPKQAEAVRYSLLHDSMFEDVVNSPSGSALMPIMSITSYTKHNKRQRHSSVKGKGFKTNKALPSANMSANKCDEPESIQTTVETLASTPHCEARTQVAVGEQETCNTSDLASISSTEDDSSLSSCDENTNMSEVEIVKQVALPYIDTKMAKLFGLAKSTKSTKYAKCARSSRSARPRRPSNHAPLTPRASPTRYLHNLHNLHAHNVDEQHLDAPPRPSTACSVAFHMQPEQQQQGPLEAPTKFLGYTRGVGVFRGAGGGLVDAGGVAFTQGMKIPTPGSDQMAMGRDIRARHVFDIDEGELRLGMGEHYARRLARLTGREPR